MLLARNAEEIGGGSGRKLSETQTGDKREGGGTCAEVAELQGQEASKHATPTPFAAQSALLSRSPWGAVCTLSFYN